MGTCQEEFHRRWGHLTDRCVRDLAWLLDAPDMLDPDAATWAGRVVALPSGAADRAHAWLERLDRSPEMLHGFLDLDRTPRVGRYAEKLLAYYFQEQGLLTMHSLQVRSEPGTTVGEFDFLLRRGESNQLDHRELATKFYLLAADFHDVGAEYFLGPNLADSLQEKMRKILDRQLALGTHPASQGVLPGPVASAQAFVKGWLFWPLSACPSPDACRRSGLSPSHCSGRWMTPSELVHDATSRYLILPRLQWLAPAQSRADQVRNADALRQLLAQHFEGDNLPVLVAALDSVGAGIFRERERFFVVPEDWRERALRVTGRVPERAKAAG